MRVRFFANLREAAGGRELELALDKTEPLSQVIERIIDRCPDLAPLMLTDRGDLADHIAVIVNGRHIRHLDGTETMVTDDDQLDIFPPVGGGGSGAKSVQVHFGGDLHAIVGGGGHKILVHGETLGELLEQSIHKFAIEDEIIERDGVKASVQVTVNGRLAYTIGGWDAEVNEGDQVWIFSFGGALQPVRMPEGTTLRELSQGHGQLKE
jgi:molybdopterin synthase sulfur carrier subunit